MGGEEDYLKLNEEVRNAKKPEDVISLVKKYEDLLKEATRKIIKTVGKQGELLKRFRDAEVFFDCIGLSRSNIYFRISLYKCLRKFPLLKNSTLQFNSSYYKSNFKVVKKVCKANVNVFGETKWKYLFYYFLYFLSLFG